MILVLRELEVPGAVISKRFSCGAKYGEIEKKSLCCGRTGAFSVSIISPNFFGATSSKSWLSMI